MEAFVLTECLNQTDLSDEEKQAVVARVGEALENIDVSDMAAEHYDEGAVL